MSCHPPFASWKILSQARYRGKELCFERWHLEMPKKLFREKMDSLTGPVSLHITLRTGLRAQGHGRLIVQCKTRLWLCRYHPLRNCIKGSIWMRPRQGLTAVSELSISERETDKICITSFLLYIFRWVGCLSHYTINPKLPSLPPHSPLPSPTLLNAAIFS